MGIENRERGEKLGKGRARRLVAALK